MRILVRSTAATAAGTAPQPVAAFTADGVRDGVAVDTDGRPLIRHQLLMREEAYGRETMGLHEVVVPAPGGELTALPPFAAVELVDPTLDVWVHKPSGALRTRWSAEAIRVVGAGAEPEPERGRVRS